MVRHMEHNIKKLNGDLSPHPHGFFCLTATKRVCIVSGTFLIFFYKEKRHEDREKRLLKSLARVFMKWKF